MSRVFPYVIGQETSFLVPLKCRVSERVKMSIETAKFRSVTFRRGKHGLALINEQQSVQSRVCILTETIVFYQIITYIRVNMRCARTAVNQCMCCRGSVRTYFSGQPQQDL